MIRRNLIFLSIIGFCMAGPIPARADPTPLPLSAVFLAENEIATPAPSLSPTATPAASPTPPPPTPYPTDPLGPPVSLPRVALLPSPTPAATRDPVIPEALFPEGFRRADLYVLPGQMGRSASREPFWKAEPGRYPDVPRGWTEVALVNEWRNLCVELRLERKDAGDPGATNAAKPPGAFHQLTVLYRPGQSDLLRIPAGLWQVSLRCWEPLDPFPERVEERPAQELTEQRRFTATLDRDGERGHYNVLHAAGVAFREARMQGNPVLSHGKATPPAPKPY